MELTHEQKTQVDDFAKRASEELSLLVGQPTQFGLLREEEGVAFWGITDKSGVQILELTSGEKWSHFSWRKAGFACPYQFILAGASPSSMANFVHNRLQASTILQRMKSLVNDSVCATCGEEVNPKYKRPATASLCEGGFAFILFENVSCKQCGAKLEQCTELAKIDIGTLSLGDLALLDLQSFVKATCQTAYQYEFWFWVLSASGGNWLPEFYFGGENGRPIFVDFYNPQTKTVIELDGESHKLPAQREKDNKRDAWLISQGATVLRIDVTKKSPYLNR